jgi:5-methylthioadenosine/S-adenosylhomocysteine deaminase
MRRTLYFVILTLLLASFASASRRQRPEKVDLIIQGGTVVTMDRGYRLIEQGAVAVNGQLIVAVGTAAEIAVKYTSIRTINAAGRVVMPGLINTHTHVPMVLFRGIADDLVLMEWLQKFIFPQRQRMLMSSSYDGARVSAVSR